jgi:hypothetical protein
MKPISLREQWERLVKAAGISSKGTVQHQEMFLAYMAGAAAYEALMEYISDDMCSEEEGMRLLETTSAELGQFVEALKAGRA